MSIASLVRNRTIRTTPPPLRSPTDALGDLAMPEDDASKKTDRKSVV